MYEVARMQGMISQWVQWLTSLSVEALFSATELTSDLPPVEVCSKYVQCSHCGELVQQCKAVRLGEGLMCMPCAHGYIQDSADVYPAQ
jgi:formylmethanofuran dehydrogenase subunit E